jgi:hypothetical protein
MASAPEISAAPRPKNAAAPPPVDCRAASCSSWPDGPGAMPFDSSMIVLRIVEMPSTLASPIIPMKPDIIANMPW